MSAVTSPDLSSVTLLCIDGINPSAALLALERSVAGCRFARAALLTPDATGLTVPAGVEIVPIAPLTSRQAYSRFLLNELGAYFSTPYVLIAQWDGYVVNPDAWSSDFLRYDYIGAKWWHRDGHNVGNGGFSLRSRKLVDAVASLGLVDCDHNEDDVICRAGRPALETRHGIRFAPESVADRFAFERGLIPEPGQPLPFGFHGWFNMWRFLSPAELERLLTLLHPRTLGYVETLELAQQYLKLRRHEETIQVVTRVLDHNPGSVPALKMLALSAHHSGRKWLAAQAMRELQRAEAAVAAQQSVAA